MAASILDNLTGTQGWTSLPVFRLLFLFLLWMCIDAIRRGEWIWAVCIWFFPLINATLYYIFVYRANSATRGFELPGTAKRKRIKELQAQIHHLDNAVHYFQLGDIYFQMGKLEKAEAAYRASLERDPKDIDARAHLGQCLLREKRAAEARPRLELRDVLSDDVHAPAFQRKRDRVWVRRARGLAGKIGVA